MIFTAFGLTRFVGVFRTRLVPLVAPAAAALVLARYYSYDPYYAPDHIRMSDGIVPGWWIVFIVAFAVAAAAVTRRSLRIGLIATSAVMWLCAVTVFVAGRVISTAATSAGLHAAGKEGRGAVASVCSAERDAE